LATTVFPADDELDGLLVGTESITWSVASDARLTFAMLYPLLLQVSHPTVGAGVRDYSDFERHPWERLLATVDYVSLLVYGGRDAVPAGRRLRAAHRRLRGVREDGKRYHALEPDAYAWVHATLLETYVVGTQQFGAGLGPEDVEAFYREYRGLGRLIGVRERDLPSDWDGFRRYVDRTVREELVHTEAVDQVLRAVRNLPSPQVSLHVPQTSLRVPPTSLRGPQMPLPVALRRAIRIPAGRAAWIGGIGLMDSSLRRRLGIGWSPLDEAQFRAMGAALRALTPVMPERWRVTGPAQLRWRRREIAEGPLGRGSHLDLD
jgi:uncharacterized protein (DUF2236 family)